MNRVLPLSIYFYKMLRVYFQISKLVSFVLIFLAQGTFSFCITIQNKTVYLFSIGLLLIVSPLAIADFLS